MTATTTESTYRIVVLQNDGRRSKVLHDILRKCLDDKGAIAVADQTIRPYEGGRSHVPGVSANVYRLDGERALPVATRFIDTAWAIQPGAGR